MNCPYCNQEMKKGMLQTSRVITFGTNVHKVSFIPRKDEIIVAPDGMAGARKEAYLCEKCDIIIVPNITKDKE